MLATCILTQNNRYPIVNVNSMVLPASASSSFSQA